MNQDTDLFGRVAQFVEAGDPRLVSLSMIALLLLGLLAVCDKRLTLVFLSLIALVVGDAPSDALASGATLGRWAIIALITLMNLRGFASPGKPVLLLASYGAFGVLSAPLAPAPLFALQSGGLMLLTTLGLGSALAYRLRTFEDIVLLLKIILIAAGAWVLVSLLYLPEMVGGERFSGSMTSAPLFAITGGLFLPVALWGALDLPDARWRIYCRGIGVGIVFLLLLCGQRTGAIAGALGCAPIFLRRGQGAFRIVAILWVFTIVAVGLVFVLFPIQTGFILDRYGEAGFHGREERWLSALYACLSSPFLPHGIGSAEDLLGFGAHNSYLVAWFEGGVLGLGLFLWAFIAMMSRALNLIYRSSQAGVVSVARLSACVLTVLMLSGLAEAKMISPSNMLMNFSVIFATILYRLDKTKIPVAGSVSVQRETPRSESHADLGVALATPRTATRA